MDTIGPPADPMFDTERKRFSTSGHYWSHPTIIDKKVFDTFQSFCKTMYESSGIILANGKGLKGSKPTFSNDLVCFNGAGPADGDTFYFPRVSDDLFGVVPPQSLNLYERLCNTHRFPYDTMVVACLEAAVYFDIIPSWRSDGYKEDHLDGLILFVSIKNFHTKEEIN